MGWKLEFVRLEQSQNTCTDSLKPCQLECHEGSCDPEVAGDGTRTWKSTVKEISIIHTPRMSMLKSPAWGLLWIETHSKAPGSWQCLGKREQLLQTGEARSEIISGWVKAPHISVCLNRYFSFQLHLILQNAPAAPEGSCALSLPPLPFSREHSGGKNTAVKESLKLDLQAEGPHKEPHRAIHLNWVTKQPHCRGKCPALFPVWAFSSTAGQFQRSLA